MLTRSGYAGKTPHQMNPFSHLMEEGDRPQVVAVRKDRRPGWVGPLIIFNSALSRVVDCIGRKKTLKAHNNFPLRPEQ